MEGQTSANISCLMELSTCLIFFLFPKCIGDCGSCLSFLRKAQREIEVIGRLESFTDLWLHLPVFSLLLILFLCFFFVFFSPSG